VPPNAQPAALKRLLVLFAALAALLGESGAAAAPPLAGRAYELADAAYKAIEAEQLDQALGLATEALALEPGHPSLVVLQADVLSRLGRDAEAYERLRGLGAPDLGGNGLAQRGYLALKLRNRDAAEADFAAAMKAGDLSAEARANVASELAYLALARKDDAAAERWFRVALEGRGTGASRASLYADAGYTAMRRADNDTAVQLLSRAVDEWHAAPPARKPFDEQSLYGLRRSVDSLSRMFGATFSVGHGSVASGSTLAPGALGVLQAGAEVFFRPPGIGYRDGRIFEVYANGFQAVDAEEREFPTGSQSRVGGVGLRYKPLRDHNLVLALEYRAAIGEQAGEDDWLLRAGWSASRGTDWEPVRASWFTWQAYTETVYFTRAERWVQPFEARVGYSWKLSPSPATVVTPFAGIGGEFDEAQSEKWAAGIGPGIAVRHWFRDSRHRAYASYIDLSLQYRFRVTEAQRGEGWFGLLAITF
jgi:bacteriophage N4 adsorption protein A